MGDKTQLATVALSAQIGADMLSILVGTTLGMLVADASARKPAFATAVISYEQGNWLEDMAI